MNLFIKDKNLKAIIEVLIYDHDAIDKIMDFIKEQFPKGEVETIIQLGRMRDKPIKEVKITPRYVR